MKKCKRLHQATRYENTKDMIEKVVSLYPDKNAFIVKHKNGKEVTYENITYSRFKEEINAFGTGLLEMGLKDKRIAIIGKNRYEWGLTYVTILSGGAVAVPLDKGLPPNEIEQLLERSKAEIVVFEKEYMQIMNQIDKNKSTNVKEYICMDDIENEKVKTIKQIIEKGKNELEKGNNEYINTEIDNKKMAVIVFTSGTTSKSKGVMLSQYNIFSNIYDMEQVEDFRSTDVNFALLPFHHMFGSTALLIYLSDGLTNVFCDGLRHIQENLKEYNVTIFVGVPLLLEAMYKKIIRQVEKQKKTRLIKMAVAFSNFLRKFGIDIRRRLFKEIIDNLGGELRLIVSGASALDKEVAKGLNDFGILTVQGYGLTETSPVLSAESEGFIRYGSIGLPMPSVEIKIDNPNENGIGEIIVKGPNVMLGYYDNEEETNAVMKDGWFYTGDLGYIDKDGFIFVTGRKKNVIVLKNGKNVYPEELEQLVNNLPYVAESMVFGKPKDDDFIVSVKIVYNEEYVNEKYPNIVEEDLKNIIWKDIKQINSGLTNYKHIKNLIITKEPMIKTTTQKVKRYEEIDKMEK